MAYIKLSEVEKTDTLNDNDSLIVILDKEVKQVSNAIVNENIKTKITEAIEENNAQIETVVNEKIQEAKELQKEYTDGVKLELIEYTDETSLKILSKVGTDTVSTKIYSLRNAADDTQLVYSLNDLILAPVGTIVYQDKDCTIEYGKVTYNMSGTLKIDTDQSIYWALNGSEEYVSDKRIATEAGVKNYVDETYSEKEWTTESNANDYTTSGVYQFAGWRKNAADNLPITNYAEDEVDRNNVAFTLIVNTKEGYLVRNDEGNVTRNIPTMIAQTLMLGNRRGSDTKIYTRHGQVDLSTNTTTWGEWKEVMTSTYLGVLDSYTGDLLNGATEIGLYTGAMVDLASNVADVFKLEVINNYAVTAAVGTSIPNHVLQTITILNLDGSNTTKKRTGTYGDSGYTWSEWKEEVGGASTTKFKRGDVVILQQNDYSPQGRASIGTKVISWEEFKKTYQNYAYPGDAWQQGEFPIGLIVDPQKKTFIYLRTKVIENAPSSGSTDDIFCDLLFNSLHDGLGNTQSLMRQEYIDKNIIDVLPSTNSIFYNGASHQLTQFIPSRDENVLLTNVFYDKDKGLQNYRDRIEELNAMMGDEDIYPTTYHQSFGAFYTYTSSLVKTTDSIFSNVSYTFYTSNNQLDVPLSGQHSKTDRIVYGILMNDEE